MSEIPGRVVPIGATRDRWMDACGAATFVSFLLIVGHVAGPPLAGLSVPYSGGGAVVLGLGALVCLGLGSASARAAASIALVGLMVLRAVTPLWPGLLIAEHGELSALDASGMAVLILTAAALTRVAPRSSPAKPGEPHGAATNASA